MNQRVRALVDKTVARLGRLDAALNNAGTEGQVGPITDQTYSRSGRRLRPHRINTQYISTGGIQCLTW
jgi:NAD(P)-dependent dehydrogenase (short-subunit alcohol dehydrogenase family)